MQKIPEIPGYHFPDEAGFDEILSRLKSVSKSSTNRALSLSLGLKRAAVGVAKSRHQIPASWIVEATIRFSTSALWLLLGQTGDQLSDDYYLLPVLKMVLSENGELNTGNSKDSFVFIRSWLESKGTPEYMRLLRMNGSAMEPLVQDKDLMLINTGDIETDSESDIFLISFNKSVFIRRIAMEPGKMIIRAENTKLVPDVSINLSEQDLIKVLGKVIWWGHERA